MADRAGHRLSRAGRTTLGAAALLGLALAAGEARAFDKATAPVPGATLALMAARDTSPSAPILFRSYKKEAEIEVWKLARSGRYVFLKTFPICRWSGQLGPKRHVGDRQTPEGFYAVAARQMNPNSHYYLSFDVGFPNAYDRAHGATGSAVMVHGICSSAGCFAMTNGQVGEIFALARDALAGGQQAFQFQSYPFRMSAANMAKYRQDANMPFWRNLKEGSDRFEATGEALAVGVKDSRYVFAPSRDPAREAQASERRTEQDAAVATLVSDGAASVRISYQDGGQHATFAVLMRRGASLGDISRPEALAFAGLETTLIPARRHPAHATVQVATAIVATPAANPVKISVSWSEPSLFAATALGAVPALAPATPLSGAARIVPASFAAASFRMGELAGSARLAAVSR